MSVALITGGSRGLGRALAEALAERHWQVVIDGRDSRALHDAAQKLSQLTTVCAIAGDVADADHRRALMDAARNWAAWTCWSTTPASSDQARSRNWRTTRSTSFVASSR